MLLLLRRFGNARKHLVWVIRAGAAWRCSRQISTKAPDALHSISKHCRLGAVIVVANPGGESPPATTTPHEDATHGTHASRSHVLPIAQDGQRGTGRDAGVRRTAHQREERKEGRPRCRRHRPGIAGLRPAGGQARSAERRQRAAPLRLERVQLAPLRVRAEPAHGTAIPRAAGDEQLAHPRRRYGARSAQPAAGEGHRGRGGDGEDRVRRTAHRALRSRRHLPERARRAGRRRTGRHLHARPRDVRVERDAGSRTAGRSTSRTTSAWHLGSRRHDHQRVGDAEHGGERRQPGAAAGRQVRQRAARLGSAPPHAPAEAGARRRAADGARAAAGTRSETQLRLRGRGAQSQGPLELHLDVASRRSDRSLGDAQGHRDPRRAGRSVAAPAAPARFQGRAATRHGHQSLARRPLPVRELLGDGRAACSTT